MNIQQEIESLGLKQLLIIAVVLAFLIIVWRNRDFFQAKLNPHVE